MAHCVTCSVCLCLHQTVFRIVVLGIWDYIENKVEVGTAWGEPLALLLGGPPAALSFPQCQSAEEAKLCIFPGV